MAPPTHLTPPTAPWRTPAHLRRLQKQIEAAPPSPLPGLLHISLYSILPFLFFTTFIIAGTVVLSYTLSLAKPVPVHFVIGATVAFAVLVLLGLVAFVLVRLRRKRMKALGAGAGERENGDVEARLTGGRPGASYPPVAMVPKWDPHSAQPAQAPIQHPPAAHIPELGPHSTEQIPAPSGAQVREQQQGRARSHHHQFLRQSHELQAPPRVAHQPRPHHNPVPRPPVVRKDTPAPDLAAQYSRNFPKEGMPLRDRYPRHSTVPVSPASNRTSVYRFCHPSYPGKPMDATQNAYAPKATDGGPLQGEPLYRGLVSRAGTPAPEPVPVLPNKLRKARGLGVGVGKGRRMGKEEVVLESVEVPTTVGSGLGIRTEKGKAMGFGKEIDVGGLDLAEFERKVQKRVFVLHGRGG